MHIANPIYDVVFKYLMEDSKLAKLMISAIIGEEVVKLNFLPPEFAEEPIELAKKKQKNVKKKGISTQKRLGLTVYRLDFTAKIKTAEGEKQVIIELQKAKFPTDIMRFRKYLGKQFSNKENTTRILINGKNRKIGLPIISIYFLGHALDHTSASAIKVSRQYLDLITGEEILTKESFIESLTLDSYVIQIPSLKPQKRNDLEILLSVFDQSTAIDDDHHILNMEEKEFPAKFRPIIRKLHQAVQIQEIKNKMELEDGIIDELEEMEREIEELEQKNKQAEAENKRIEFEKMKVEEENKRIEEEKAQVQAENKRIEEENKRIEEEKVQVQSENKRMEEENEALRKKIAELLGGNKD
jgi:hypothetical protein